MDNKEEKSIVVEKKSGETDQTDAMPAVGAGVGESKTVDPLQAKPTPGDQDETRSDDTTNGIKGGEASWNRG